MVAKIGRNEDCPCGSKKKHKFCCGAEEKPEDARPKMLNQTGLNRCFLKLVKDAGGVLEISCEDIDAIPKEELLAIKHNVMNDSFHFSVVKVKKSPIIQPNARLKLLN